LEENLKYEQVKKNKKIETLSKIKQKRTRKYTQKVKEATPTRITPKKEDAQKPKQKRIRRQ